MLCALNALLKWYLLAFFWGGAKIWGRLPQIPVACISQACGVQNAARLLFYLTRSDSAAEVVGSLWWREERPGRPLTPLHAAAPAPSPGHSLSDGGMVSTDYGMLEIIGSFACYPNRDWRTLTMNGRSTTRPGSLRERSPWAVNQPPPNAVVAVHSLCHESRRIMLLSACMVNGGIAWLVAIVNVAKVHSTPSHWQDIYETEVGTKRGVDRRRFSSVALWNGLYAENSGDTPVTDWLTDWCSHPQKTKHVIAAAAVASADKIVAILQPRNTSKIYEQQY